MCHKKQLQNNIHIKLQMKEMFIPLLQFAVELVLPTHSLITDVQIFFAFVDFSVVHNTDMPAVWPLSSLLQCHPLQCLFQSLQSLDKKDIAT